MKINSLFDDESRAYLKKLQIVIYQKTKYRFFLIFDSGQR